uniref:Uncharacterized protein n=1 Tax=Arundo donax TaxID=35708 RepID=A0A0A9GSP1_ARUDO
MMLLSQYIVLFPRLGGYHPF